ncbi:MAG: hypothetical protein FE835_19365 [Gammaproteobacteria bacterium]|nr:hypothetical protein [Gammaproteobacteria bacterium]
MTAYNAIPAADIDPDSPITTSLMTHIRDNPIAISEGSTGAPRIKTDAYEAGSVNTDAIAQGAVSRAEIANEAIHRGHIKMGEAKHEVSVPPGGSRLLVLSGGLHVFNVFFGTADDFNNNVEMTPFHTNERTGKLPFHPVSVTTAAVRFRNSHNHDAKKVTVHYAYPMASPPYDHGDGEIGHYIFALMDKTTGQPVALSEGPDAPWHNNGPTQCSAEFYDKAGQGRRYRRKLPVAVAAFTPVIDELRAKRAAGEILTQANIDLIRDYGEAFVSAPLESELITQAIKQADMGLIPHPWPDYDKDRYTVVLLDPVSDLTHKLAAARKHDRIDLIELFEVGALKITNAELNRSGPPGVKIVDYGWKSGSGIAN